MLKIPLDKPKLPNGYKQYPWASCSPFVINDRGVLIHRPRTVTTYAMHKHPHIGIGYWCGNHVAGDKNFTFTDFIPDDGKLLCAKCEAEAVRRGLPSADDLNGRHVHKGGLVAVRTCC